jgi:hypothetical protein
VSRILKVGLELEGGWGDRNSAPPFIYPIGPKGKDLEDMIHHDVSVGNTGVDSAFRMTSPHVGEIASPPMTIREAIEWLPEHYPIEVNASCGFHIHVSFKSVLDYGKLMEEEFWKFFMDSASRWGEEMKFRESHEFWRRLRGGNRFCFARFMPEEQIHLTSKPQDGPRRDIRRTHLNYCYGFPNPDGTPRKTLECRVFPQFKKVDHAIAALEWLTGMYEEFLSKTPRERRLTVVVKKEDLLKPQKRNPPTKPPARPATLDGLWSFPHTMTPPARRATIRAGTLHFIGEDDV